jgi:hypothetical protein
VGGVLYSLDLNMETESLLGIAIGIGLSVACGLRVFVPLLVMNLAVLTGHLHLSPGFEWIGSDYAPGRPFFGRMKIK